MPKCRAADIQRIYTGGSMPETQPTKKTPKKTALPRFSHQLRLMQMQGVRCEDVVIHFECLTTQQLRKDRLALVANKDNISLDIFQTHFVKNNIAKIFHNL